MVSSELLKEFAASYFVNCLNTVVSFDGFLRFYSGSAPATPEDSPTGTLIAECALDSTPFFFDTPDEFHANAITDDTDTVAGTVGYARLEQNGGTCLMQFTVSTSPGTDFIFDSLDFADGDTLEVTVVNGTCDLAP
jgi:hypothetical protein